jgi:hypothetical protein
LVINSSAQRISQLFPVSSCQVRNKISNF